MALDQRCRWSARTATAYVWYGPALWADVSGTARLGHNILLKVLSPGGEGANVGEAGESRGNEADITSM